MHGLNDDDSIIHHDTDGQYECNKVSRLIVKPNSCMKKNVPMIATGTAIAGISVERKSCRKMNTTINTRMKASISVCFT